MQTILVVDDQEIVRRVLKAMLGWYGFIVLEAASGTEALQTFERQQDTIACVLLDLVMPGLSGEATMCALRQVRADLPIILMSGVEREDLTKILRGYEFVGFLHKPCCLDELLKSLEGFLGPCFETIVGTGTAPCTDPLLKSTDASNRLRFQEVM